jgi:hypothetical protein
MCLSDIFLMHQHNVVYQRTYLTLFGVRVDFYECIKNRYGRTGGLVLLTPQTQRELRRSTTLVIEDWRP